MNTIWYDFGNPFKVKFRRHRCFKCGGKLEIVKDYKTVYRDSEEAKYYSFHSFGTRAVGSCMFVHKVFRCIECYRRTEFVTQTNREDIDIII